MTIRPVTRELRAALSHVDAELGTMPLRTSAPATSTRCSTTSARAGLSPRRETAIVDALRSLSRSRSTVGSPRPTRCPRHQHADPGAPRPR